MAAQPPSSTVSDGVSPARKLGIFWDFENVRIPQGVKATVAANRIRDAVIGHGQIVERRLYFDSRKRSEENTDRVSLDQGGFTLVDCPTRGTKETLDKKLIVDLMSFAFNYAAQHTPTCVVLITSDGDYAYSVARIRDLGVKTIVIHGPQPTTAGILLDNCEHALSFLHDVLGIFRHTAQEQLSGEDATEGDAEQAACSSEQDDDEKTESAIRDAIEDAIDGRHITLCHSLAELPGEDWVPDAKCALSFYKKRGITDRPQAAEDQYATTRDSAVAGGFVEVGRLDMTTQKVIRCCDARWSATMSNRLSHHRFVRLTDHGKEQLVDTTEAARMALRSHNEMSSSAPGEDVSSPLQAAQLGIKSPQTGATPQGRRAARAAAVAIPEDSKAAVGLANEDPLAYPAAPLCWKGSPIVVRSVRDVPIAKLKTVLCTHFQNNGRCEFGMKCRFAHGQEELRPPPNIVVQCRDWKRNGTCTYGSQCSFAHTAADHHG